LARAPRQSLATAAIPSSACSVAANASWQAETSTGSVFQRPSGRSASTGKGERPVGDDLGMPVESALLARGRRRRERFRANESAAAAAGGGDGEKERDAKGPRAVRYDFFRGLFGVFFVLARSESTACRRPPHGADELLERVLCRSHLSPSRTRSRAACSLQALEFEEFFESSRAATRKKCEASRPLYDSRADAAVVLPNGRPPSTSKYSSISGSAS